MLETLLSSRYRHPFRQPPFFLCLNQLCISTLRHWSLNLRFRPLTLARVSSKPSVPLISPRQPMLLASYALVQPFHIPTAALLPRGLLFNGDGDVVWPLQLSIRLRQRQQPTLCPLSPLASFKLHYHRHNPKFHLAPLVSFNFHHHQYNFKIRSPCSPLRSGLAGKHPTFPSLFGFNDSRWMDRLASLRLSSAMFGLKRNNARCSWAFCRKPTR